MECVANGACDGATIDCTGATKCEVVCKGDNSCKSAKIFCGTGPCSLSCQDHNNACGAGTELYCGPNTCSLSCAPGIDGPSKTNCDVTPCNGCPPAC